jgi:hypothetical protein
MGFDNLPEVDSIIAHDVSRMGDFPLGLRGYRTVDSLAREAQQEILSDSVMLSTRREYEIGKKRVFQICLNHYSGDKIDSIARQLFVK